MKRARSPLDPARGDAPQAPPASRGPLRIVVVAIALLAVPSARAEPEPSRPSPPSGARPAAPRPDAGAPPVAPARKGVLERQAIARVINGHIVEIQRCWEGRVLANRGSRGGKVVTEWVILPTGRVGQARIKSSEVGDDQLSACILAAIGAWTFPPPTGGSVTVTYPFFFQVL